MNDLRGGKWCYNKSFQKKKKKNFLSQQNVENGERERERGRGREGKKINMSKKRGKRKSLTRVK